MSDDRERDRVKRLHHTVSRCSERPHKFTTLRQASNPLPGLKGCQTVGVPNYFSTSASCFDSWVGAGIYAVPPSYSSRTSFQRHSLPLIFTSDVLSRGQTCQSYRSNRLPLHWCQITRGISVRSCIRAFSPSLPSALVRTFQHFMLASNTSIILSLTHSS